MAWKEILESAKKSLAGKGKPSPSPFKFPSEAEEKTKKMPDVVWEYIKQKRRELTEKAKQAPSAKEYEKVVEELRQIPCGGTCPAGRQRLEIAERRQLEEIAITPKVLSTVDVGREIGQEKSWYEAQTEKIEQWTEEVAKKEVETKKKLASGLPWDEAQKMLPWDREAEAMKEHMAVVKDLKEVEKQLAMKELPWQRVKQEVGLGAVVDLAKEHLDRVQRIKQAEAHAKGRDTSEELSTDEEEILDELLDGLADHYDNKYESMRETIKRLPLMPKEKEYLGDQFQDHFDPDYDELTPAKKKEMITLAEELWHKHKGQYQKARDELLDIRNSLQIDGVEYSAADDRLDEIDDIVRKEKREEEEKEKKEIARKAATEYRVGRMTLDQLAIHLLNQFKAADDAEEHLEEFKLTEKEQDYMGNKLRSLEENKMNKAFDEAQKAAADQDEGYYGLIHRIEENDDLNENQKEWLLEDVREDMSNYADQAYRELLDTTWEYKIHQIERKREAGEIDEAAADDLVEILESEQADEEETLEEAGLENLSTEDRLKKIDEMQIPRNMKETLEELVHLIADREELTKKETEKEQREEELKEKAKRSGGEFYEKKPSGYILHFKPKPEED